MVNAQRITELWIIHPKRGLQEAIDTGVVLTSAWLKICEDFQRDISLQQIHLSVTQLCTQAMLMISLSPAHIVIPQNLSGLKKSSSTPVPGELGEGKKGNLLLILKAVYPLELTLKQTIQEMWDFPSKFWPINQVSSDCGSRVNVPLTTGFPPLLNHRLICLFGRGFLKVRFAFQRKIFLGKVHDGVFHKDYTGKYTLAPSPSHDPGIDTG